MNQKEEILIEEVLLAYLRNSKQIKIEQATIEENENNRKVSLVINVDKNFGVTLINNLDNQFSAFFNKNNEH